MVVGGGGGVVIWIFLLSPITYWTDDSIKTKILYQRAIKSTCQHIINTSHNKPMDNPFLELFLCSMPLELSKWHRTYKLLLFVGQS